MCCLAIKTAERAGTILKTLDDKHPAVDELTTAVIQEFASFASEILYCDFRSRGKTSRPTHGSLHLSITHKLSVLTISWDGPPIYRLMETGFRGTR
jgi:hypothetical protein